MQRRTSAPCALFFVAGLACVAIFSLGASPPEPAEQARTRLAVLWTSGELEVAHKARLMYMHAARTNQWSDETGCKVGGLL